MQYTLYYEFKVENTKLFPSSNAYTVYILYATDIYISYTLDVNLPERQFAISPVHRYLNIIIRYNHQTSSVSKLTETSNKLPD